METVTKFGERLLQLREERNETQEQLAKAVNITRQSLSRYETNERTPNIDLIYNVAKHYGVSADYLLGLTTVQSSDNRVHTVCELTGLSEEAVNALAEIKKLSAGEVIEPDTAQRIEEKDDMLKLHTEKQSDPQFAEISETYIASQIEKLSKERELLLKSDKDKGKRCLDAVNLLLSDKDFKLFLDNLSIYSITDFTKNSRLIQSEAGDGEHSAAFIFNSSIIEQGLLAKLQSFIMSLKSPAPEYSLGDFYTIEEEENGEYITEEE